MKILRVSVVLINNVSCALEKNTMERRNTIIKMLRSCDSAANNDGLYEDIDTMDARTLKQRGSIIRDGFMYICLWLRRLTNRRKQERLFSALILLRE